MTKRPLPSPNQSRRLKRITIPLPFEQALNYDTTTLTYYFSFSGQFPKQKIVAIAFICEGLEGRVVASLPHQNIPFLNVAFGIKAPRKIKPSDHFFIPIHPLSAQRFEGSVEVKRPKSNDADSAYFANIYLLIESP